MAVALHFLTAAEEKKKKVKEVLGLHQQHYENQHTKIITICIPIKFHCS